MLQSIHRQGYRAPDIRRVYIPKPGKTEKRPLGVPTVSDRALQRTTAEGLRNLKSGNFGFACSRILAFPFDIGFGLGDPIVVYLDQHGADKSD